MAIKESLHPIEKSLTLKNKRQYLYNGVFLLLITMLWNIIFGPYLPERYSLVNFKMNIPAIVLIGENGFRILTFGFTVFLVLGLKDRT